MDSCFTLMKSAAAVVLFSAYLGLAIVGFVYAMQEPPRVTAVLPAKVYGREIPKCDKELWVRITQGCDYE